MKPVLLTCLILACSGSLARAVEPLSPPSHGRTKQQHDWLRGNLDADMGTINTFPTDAFEEMHRMVTRATRDETDLLADYYKLTRKVAEREMRQIVQAQIAQAQVIQAQAAQARGAQVPAVQPPAAPPEDEQAKADREELGKLSKTLAAARKPARTVSEYIYASLPGWCAQQAPFVPPSYYGDGQYVGPLDSKQYAGPHAGYVYRAYMVGREGSYAADRRENRNRAANQGNSSGGNEAVPLGTNPHPVMPRPAPAGTWGNGTSQRDGFQGSPATQSNRRR